MTMTELRKDTGVLMRDWCEGDALNRWNVTPAEDRILPGVAQVFPDQVTYEFENGWVATGDLPCRKALRMELADRTVPLPDTGFSEVYLGSETPDVDYSGFCRIPTLRRRYARALINSDKAQTLRLSIATAGAVRVWAGREEGLVFEPYDRNIRHETDFEIELRRGLTHLTVMFEDLHERDTTYGFRLTLLQGTGLTAGIHAGADVEELEAAVRLLEGLRTTQVFYKGTNFDLTSDALPETPVRLFVATGGKTDARINLSRQEPVARVSAGKPGCNIFTVRAHVGMATLTRRLGTTLLANADKITSRLADARKVALIERADCGGDIIGVLASLKSGGFSVSDAAALEEALAYVEERRDCADFRIVTLLWIWRDHQHDLPADYRDRLQAALLGFRYWLDEPGNDVMWFWSENHVLCFHAAQALAGALFPDDVFGNSGKSGREMQKRGEARLLKWFDAIDLHGLAEWNSAAYYPINFRALVVVFELTSDETLRQRAKDLLDRIAAMIALHYCNGVPAGSQGRIYEMQLLAGPMTELGSVAAVLFGGQHVPGLDGAGVLLALSSYKPPESLYQFAYPPSGEELRAHYTQGLGKQARLALWKTPELQLSTVEDHHAHACGHQQHVIDLQFADGPLARIWVNHPGDSKVWGDARPSYWAGNGRLPRLRQWNRHALMVYDLKDGDLPFTHAFVPQDRLEEVLSRDGWIFARSGEGYAALYAVGGIQLQETGLYAGTEWRSEGPHQAWIVVAGNKARDGEFEDFFKARLAASPSWENGVLSCLADDDTLALPVDGPFRVNGHETGLPVESLFLDPQISANGAPFTPWKSFGDASS